MTPDQLKAILDAIAALGSHGQSLLDYIQLVLPVLTGVLGWALSAFWQNRQFRQNNAKEQYYAAREKAEELNRKYTDYLLFVQGFFNETRGLVNQREHPTNDALVDFETSWQTKLAEVHQTQRLFFPAYDISTKGISNATKAVQRHLEKLARYEHPSQGALDGTSALRESDFARINEGQELQHDLALSFESLTNEVSLTQVTITKSLTDDATRLGIVPKRVRHERRKQKGLPKGN